MQNAIVLQRRVKILLLEIVMTAIRKYVVVKLCTKKLSDKQSNVNLDPHENSD